MSFLFEQFPGLAPPGGGKLVVVLPQKKRRIIPRCSFLYHNPRSIAIPPTTGYECNRVISAGREFHSQLTQHTP